MVPPIEATIGRTSEEEVPLRGVTESEQPSFEHVDSGPEIVTPCVVLTPQIPLSGAFDATADYARETADQDILTEIGDNSCGGALAGAPPPTITNSFTRKSNQHRW